MLTGMGERGPDSAGFAVYRPPAAGMTVEPLTLHHQDEGYPWPKLLGGSGRDPWRPRRGRGAGEPLHADERRPGRGNSGRAGRALARGARRGNRPEHEIYKEKGRPEAVAGRFRLTELGGSHAIGHTRMATESAVTTEHSHPFTTGLNLCLVHNGSLSNHNRLRLELQRHGIRFQTDNDTEVAAGYLTWRLGEGASLDEALEAALDDLDGFYTFAVGTRDGFAVLRDPFACKPAVLAETDEWVAMASEYRSIAHLPGAETARIWEPEPATVYSWARHSRCIEVDLQTTHGPRAQPDPARAACRHQRAQLAGDPPARRACARGRP